MAVDQICEAAEAWFWLGALVLALAVGLVGCLMYRCEMERRAAMSLARDDEEDGF